MGRIVYVLRAFPEPSETFIRTEIRALRKLGTQTTVLTALRSDPPAEDWTEDDERQTPVIVLPDPGIPDPAATLRHATLGPRTAIRLGRLTKRAELATPLIPKDTTILHAHFANDAAVLAREISARTNIPYRVTAQAYDLYQDPLQLEANLLQAQRVITISNANAAWIRERVPNLAHVEVIRCGIDLEKFPYRDPPPPHNPARLLCVARLVPKKGHAVLFEAVRLLNEGGTPVVLACAGTGPLEAELRAKAPPGVTFLGNLSHDAVKEEMLRSDVVVLASRIAEDGDRDGIPVALIEAMALGVPVVATCVAGITELVARDFGRVVESNSPIALAEGVRRSIAAGKEPRLAGSRLARRRVETEHDGAKTTAELA